MEGLKKKAIRGGFAKLVGQAFNFGLRILFLVVMARLLDPEDFGLVAMVTVIAGLFGLLALSSATVQKDTITDEQMSTLFWINLLIGALLAGLCVLAAPILVAFYSEPRLYWITVSAGTGFIFSTAAAQHLALLERQLRFITLAVIDIVCQLVGLVVGVGLALAGFGYWALVASTIALPAMTTICAWTVTGWTPGRPRRKAGVRSLLHFGGTVTLNTVVTYVAYNFEKVLLGRFWGADVLGLYGRAYQLINIPTQNLNVAVGGVTFAALSRLQNDPIRLRSYFLKSYGLASSLTLPTTMFCALFAEDIVLVALGPKWAEAASTFRLLSPTVLVFGIINPTAWLMVSTGLQVRSLRIALVIAPLVIAAYIIGMPYGANGVALAYSTAMTLWLVPHILWSLHGTPISPWSMLVATSKPFISALIAAAIAFATAHYFVRHLHSPFFRLALEAAVMFVVYYWVLLFIMGEKALYLDLLRELRGSSSTQEG